MNLVQLEKGHQVVAHVDISHLLARQIRRGTPGVVVGAGLTGLFVEFHVRASSGRVHHHRMWVARNEVSPV